MQRTATYVGKWTYTREDGVHQESVAGKVFDTVLGIIKDSLVMSVAVMMGAALTLLLG